MDLNNPAIWGSQAWRKFHTKALYYPDNPTPQDRHQIRNFYEREFYSEIPCDTCRTSYIQFIRQHPIRSNSRTELFNWSIDIHNMVNKKLNKKQITYTEAYAIWLGPSAIIPPQQINPSYMPYGNMNPQQYMQTAPNISNTTIPQYAPPASAYTNQNKPGYPAVYPLKYIPIQNYPYQQMAIPSVPTETVRQNIDRTKQMIRHNVVPKR